MFKSKTAYLYKSKEKRNEVRKFDRANNPNSKKRVKRIEEENKLMKEFLRGIK